VTIAFVAMLYGVFAIYASGKDAVFAACSPLANAQTNGASD